LPQLRPGTSELRVPPARSTHDLGDLEFVAYTELCAVFLLVGRRMSGLGSGASLPVAGLDS